MAITDHTTAIARAASKGKGRASDAGQGQKDVAASLRRIESTHNQVVTAFLRVVSDGKLHDLRKTIVEYADIKSLLDELKLSRQQVKAILSSSSEIKVAEAAGTAWIVLESVGREAAARTAALQSSPRARAESKNTPTLASPSTSSNKHRFAKNTYDEEDDEEEERSISVAPSSSRAKVSTSSNGHKKTTSESLKSDSPWALKKPEKQSSSFNLVKEPSARKSLSELARQAGHKPPGYAKNSGTSPNSAKSGRSNEVIDLDDEESEPLDEGNDLFGISDASEEGEDEQDDQPKQTIGKTSIPVPNVPSSIRKQPNLPPILLSTGPRPQDGRRTSDSSAIQVEEHESPRQAPTASGSLFRRESPEEEKFELPPPLSTRDGRQPAPEEKAALPTQQMTGYEEDDDNVGELDDLDRTMQPVNDDLVEPVDNEIKEAAQPFESSQETHSYNRRPSMSSIRRSRRAQEEAAMDLDEAASADEEQEIANMLTASNKQKPRKEKMPAPMLDGYRAARSAEAGPPGLREKPSRDSSAQEDSAVDEEEEADEEGKEVEKEISVKPKARSGPTKPGARNKYQYVEDDDDDDDVVVVTTTRVGASPPKPQKSKEEREIERALRRKHKEEERNRPQKSSSSKKKRNLPHYRLSEAQEDEQLQSAYTRRQEALGGVPVEEEQSSWRVFESFEAPKMRGRRPDHNTVKFWPYNLPYPGRLEGEAIVALAGGCNVRCFRLSEDRGVQELWNVVDESANWEKDETRENYFAMAWTHELREGTAVSPYWRKWPILLVGGASKEVKVLDGYTGTTLKVIQGHGGDIYSISVHPTLSHVIATASVDEAISLWDISVPVSKPDTQGRVTNALEEDKRRKGYAEGERLCLFAGLGGHVEAVMSVAFHPTLPFLASGGVDCKLRIWRLPDTLPQYATSSLLRPIPLPQPKTSVRPPCFAFPAFVHESLHSRYIDHISWVGNDGMLLTRSNCWDSQSKKIIRLFRPTFFDTWKAEEAKAEDHLGANIEYPGEVELYARWTVAAGSENIGDGVICESNELALVRGKPIARRIIYFPSMKPAVHTYALDTKNKQEDLEEQKRSYVIKLGDEILKDDKRYVAQLRAIDCQSAGRGWMVAVGELEKMVVWIKKETVDMEKIRAVVKKRLAGIEESDEEEEAAPAANGYAEPQEEEDDIMPIDESLPSTSANGHAGGRQAVAEEAQTRDVDMERSPSVEYIG